MRREIKCICETWRQCSVSALDGHVIRWEIAVHTEKGEFNARFVVDEEHGLSCPLIWK